MFLKLAWRNIWRNKTRTIITAASIFLAVVLCSIQSAIQKGSYDRMINNVVGFYTGYLQIHQKGYWKEKILDNSMAFDSQFREKIAGNHVKGLVPRLESYALVSSEENKTRGAMIVGIDPEREDELTSLSNRIVKGSYLSSSESGILIPAGIAEKLDVQENDTIVIIGQGYHGATAAGKYPVRGIVQFPTSEMNDAFVYLPIQQAQNLFNATDLVTSVVVNLEDQDKVGQVQKALKGSLDESVYEIMDWKEMLPELVQSIEADKAGALITKGILYMIMAFGIFGTVLMMTAERQFEFGVLVAVGMKKMQLASVMILEIIMIAAVGVTAGMLVSVPVSWIFNINPITLTGETAEAYERMGVEPVFPAAVEPLIFVNQGIIVFVIAVLIGIYPMYKIFSLDPITAMKK